MAALAAAAAFGAQPATAAEYNFGGVQVYFDTTVSVGASMRVAERNAKFLPEGNGGPTDPRGNAALGGTTLESATVQTFGGAARGVPAATGLIQVENDPDNLDGSLNTDDGRLNFDRWDLTSGTVKMTNDIQANYENFTFFARLNSFYDAVLDRDSSYARSRIGDGAKTDAARDVDLLDFYVSGDFSVGDLPLNVRVGKQVVNWGEATFMLNGISSWNPFDVNAFRRPGAEIKEGLVPIWGAYASLGLPYDLSLEAFYQLEWEEFQLDRPGTPFAGSDVARVGSLTGGNVGGVSFIGGSPFAGTYRRNCNTANALDVLAADIGLTPGTNYLANCTNGSLIDYDVAIPFGQNEQVRLANGDLNTLRRGNDLDAKDSGQYGAALRWYAEDLNSTEFGFYFMNYHSRLPIAEISATTPVVSLSVSSNSDTALTRQLGNAGCAVYNGDAYAVANLFTAPALATTVATVQGAPAAAIPLFAAGGNFLDPTLNGAPGAPGLAAVTIADPNGFMQQLAPIATQLAADLAIPLPTGLATFVGAPDTFKNLAAMNCILSAAQSAQLANPANANTDELTALGALLPARAAGATTLNVASGHSLRLVYPEDIQLFGMSFNTTVGDWGVQGEVSFRHDQPLQVDTDSQTIASALNQCAFVALAGDFAGTFAALATQTGATCDPANIGNRASVSHLREEVMTFDVGTTATYTNSNPLIGALGADIGILLTEVGAMWVPDVPDEGVGRKLQLGNVCTAGTDLALKGVLALDAGTGCRPTQFSYGYVLVGILQYNNAFGTPFTLSPQIAWSHDVKGNSPAPLSNYREGSKSVSLALNATYQSAWRGGISYVNNFGNEKYSKDGDKDFVSINLSYSF